MKVHQLTGEVASAFKDRCAYCGVMTTLSGIGRYELDHIVPISRGGTNHVHNIANSCKPCNRSKLAHEVFSWFRAQVFWTREGDEILRSHMSSGIVHTERTEFVA